MTTLETKTILVTGSAGFIGFFTSKRLLEMGAKVVGVDNFNNYYDVSLKEARNKILETYPNFTLCRGDLGNETFVKSVFTDNKIDLVCHLAAQPGVRYSLQNPSAYIQSNVVAFANLIEAIRQAEIKDFVYASSSSIYGHNKKVPFSVEDRVDEPVSLYAATKKSNEMIAYTYNHLFGINTTGLRFFTVIGPFGRPDMAPMLFTKAILQGEAIKVFNHGKMQRDFTYIDDIVEGIILSLSTSDGCRVLNLGNNNPVELEYFISCIEKELGVKAKKEYLGMQDGDVPITYADIDATTKMIGWKPKTSMEESVHLFVQWYKEYFKVS
jgi:UDP-glucuronate 4-epimerase